jgi:ABC-type cobalt transport system substrate-binding protein
MFPIVELPEIVQHYTPWFEPVFSDEALIQFQRYLSGLLVSENKTVDGINRIMVHESRNQSSLNRLLTASPYSMTHLNQQRLALLASLPGTQMKPKGVLGVDDTHLIHYGMEFEQIVILWDPVEQRYAPAHNLVTLHYSDDQTDYPVFFQLWQPADLERIEAGVLAAGVKLRPTKMALKESDPKKWRQYLLGVWSRHQGRPEVAALYESKLLIARRQLAQFVVAYPGLKLPVTFDNWYTQPAFCRYLDQELRLPYVGTLAEDDEVVLKTGKETLKSFADRLKQEHLAAIEAGEKPLFHKITIPYKGEKETYYSYCRTLRIHNFGKQRLVINYSRADLSDSPRFYNSNCLYWQASGITRIRRHRWPVEVYHQEGKAEGLDQYQVRDFQAISRHIGLVATTYSLLRAAPHDQTLKHKLQRQLKYELEDSAPAWRRATRAQSLWNLGALIATGLALGQTLPDVLSPLLAKVYA